MEDLRGKFGNNYKVFKDKHIFCLINPDHLKKLCEKNWDEIVDYFLDTDEFEDFTGNLTNQ